MNGICPTSFDLFLNALTPALIYVGAMLAGCAILWLIIMREPQSSSSKCAHGFGVMLKTRDRLDTEGGTSKSRSAEPRSDRKNEIDTTSTMASIARPSQATKSRIVPVSLDPTLLSEADRYAKNAGISRSRLVSEALRLRINQPVG
jgi:hypothetical protein